MGGWGEDCLQPGRSAGTHSQACSANPPAGRSAGHGGAHSQTGSVSPPGYEGVQTLIPR